MAHWRRGWPIDRVEVADDLIGFVTTNPKSGRTRYCWLRVRIKSNVLFHGPDHKCFYDAQADFFEALGGIQHHVFTHAPEVSPAADLLVQRYRTRNWLPQADVAYLRSNVARLNFRAPPDRGRWIVGVKAIPLPGHTPGFTGYVVKSANGAWLLSGDFVLPLARGWRARADKRLGAAGYASLGAAGRIRCEGYLPNQSAATAPPPWPASPAMFDEAQAALIKSHGLSV